MEIRDGCETLFRMMQQVAENYDCAGKTVESDQIYKIQRKIIGCYVYQQRLLILFVNQKVNYQLPPYDENDSSCLFYK